MNTSKGSLQDLPVIMSVTAGFLVSLLVAGKLVTGLNQFDFFANSAAFQAAATSVTIMDYASLAVPISFLVLSIVLAARIPSTPYLIPVSVLYLGVVVFASGQISNALMAVAESSAFSGVVAGLPLTGLVINNLPLLFGVGGIAIIIAVYTVFNGGGGGVRAPV
jgi:hypothetical protein